MSKSLIRNSLFGSFAIGDGDKRSLRGFTLVETMIALAMLAALLSLAITAYVTTQSTSSYNSTQVTFQLEGRRALETMLELIKQSKRIETSGNGYTTDSNTVVFKVPAIDSNQNLITGTPSVIANDTVSAIAYEDPTNPINIAAFCVAGDASERYLEERYVKFPTRSSAAYKIHQGVYSGPGGGSANCPNDTIVGFSGSYGPSNLTPSDGIELYEDDPSKGSEIKTDLIVFNYDKTDNQLDQITVPFTGSIRPAGTVKLANNVSAITLTYLADDSSTPDSSPVVIDCSSANLDQVSQGFVTRALAVTISDCGFGSSQGIRITLTLQKPFVKKQANVTLTDEARLRNK